MVKNVKILNHQEKLKEAGVHYRLIALTGDNKGLSYILVGKRIVIGRSDKSDIKLDDAKVSREHAEIIKVGNAWMITDLGSQNGMVINDKKVVQKELIDGDRLIIGQTVFKISKIEVAENLKEENVQETDSVNSSNSNSKIIPFAMVLLVLAYIFLMDDSKSPKKVQKTEFVGTYQNLKNEQIVQVEKHRADEERKVKEKLIIYYQRGLRELREKNYFRAIHEFHLALNFSPGDAQAEYYLRKTKEELDREIEGFTAKAIRDEESLKFKSSMISYCAITRLLYSVPEDPRYKNAEKQIKELELKLGLKDGEADCLKKQYTSQ